MSEPLNRDAIYVKLYYAPTELLRGEPQGGRTERTLVDYSDMKDVHKEYLAQQARIAALVDELARQVTLRDRREAGFVETIAQLTAQLATLTAERDELNNVLRQAGWGQGEIDSAAYTFDKMAKANTALVVERDRLREALEKLHAVQNGCPLPSYERDYAEAMALTDAALRGEGG